MDIDGPSGKGREVRRSQQLVIARQQGKLRFTFLALSIVITAVVVTIVMFETLAMLAG